ncbi:ankyrin repeat and LEM domain-containing protein 2 homolog [Venturia canescens]|uniref:ankyrin repeat and LEM domain-containing protein 2 homolog n=1 Tax=Venturia canescens TaxID=32260 RepID=UPI001C9C99F8|nr:ankyrin repeat and LEM domain-containing protein 2 homolog [Venturia canescens]XP_043268393.1 ankyrin repeat and LEM domain-containing protein 2 homolog [Venturia canescens]XP_043268394.1 ankyrin repeat and LEM domain-containing protein 2 homolog [Venturia canescens]
MSSRSFADLAYGFYTNYWCNAKMISNKEPKTNSVQSVQVNFNHIGQGDSLYHAVFVPPENDNNDSPDGTRETRVYRDKLEALKVMKNYKEARLKTFSSENEAREYTLNGGEKDKLPAVPIVNGAKTSAFKGPKPQELVAFRKLIESGDLEAVKTIVWENPRYLVSSGDTPAILQEGCRFNALHIVAGPRQGHTNTYKMCEFILNTVGNPEFVKLLYGEEDHETYVDRAQILLDLYLNTPDKGLNETPLHFAAKYGLKDIVRVLVSYSQCLKNVRNKYGQTPADVICSRKCHDDEVLKKEIHMLLEDQYYVPVLRSEDNTLQPIIGDPFSPTSPQHSSKIDPISPRVEVRAFAGPMTKPQAVEFKKKWKTPPRISLNFSQRRDIALNESFNSSFSNIHDPSTRLNDTEKGLECIGRNLAEEYQVPWKEYWPFLDDFADFRCDEGLTRLEKYLENRFNDACKKEASSLKSKALVNEVRENEDVDELNNLCTKLEGCSLLANENSSEDDSDDEFFTPPSSPIMLSTNSSDDSDCEDEMSLAPEVKAIFIQGFEASKIDFAVYNAIRNDINPEVYPHIYRWRHEMQLIVDNFDCNITLSSTRRRLLQTPEKPKK